MHFEAHLLITRQLVAHDRLNMSHKLSCCYFMSRKRTNNTTRHSRILTMNSALERILADNREHPGQDIIRAQVG